MDVTQRRISIIARGVGRFTTRTMRREGIGASEFNLIQAVRCHPGITQAEVCQRLEIDKGAAAATATGGASSAATAAEPWSMGAPESSSSTACCCRRRFSALRW